MLQVIDMPAWYWFQSKYHLIVFGLDFVIVKKNCFHKFYDSKASNLLVMLQNRTDIHWQILLTSINFENQSRLIWSVLEDDDFHLSSDEWSHLE